MLDFDVDVSSGKNESIDPLSKEIIPNRKFSTNQVLEVREIAHQVQKVSPRGAILATEMKNGAFIVETAHQSSLKNYP